MAKTETKAAKLRQYAVQGVALIEEKRLGLLTDDEFDRRAKQLWEQAMGKTEDKHED